MTIDPRDITLSDDVEITGDRCPDSCAEPFTAADAAAESAMFPETHLSYED